MLVLCFAVFLGGWIPQLSPWNAPQINSVAYYQQQAMAVASTGEEISTFAFSDVEFRKTKYFKQNKAVSSV